MPCVQPNLLKNGRRLFCGTPWANPFNDGWLMLIAGPSPANTSRPRLPTYPASIDIVVVSCRCIMTLKASTVGGRCFSGSARANTPFGSGKRPEAGTAGNDGADGPC